MGFFPTAEVKLDPSASLPAMFPLAFVFVVQDGDGPLQFVCRILDPLGREVMTGVLPSTNKAANEGYTVSINIMNFVASMLGRYKVILNINGQDFERTVRVFQ
jgi:hypothetical protein